MPPLSFSLKNHKAANLAGLSVVSRQTGARHASNPARYFVTLSYSSQNTLLDSMSHVAISARHIIHSTLSREAFGQTSKQKSKVNLK